MKRLMRLSEVRSVTGLSQSTIYDFATKGKFPRQVKISNGSVAWVEEEVLAWIDARIAQRDQASRKQTEAA